MDRFVAMTSFRRVVEARGFSAAARQLGVSAAAVTKHVAWLEDELGTSLLHRTTRRVTPSDAGTAYYERCVRILDDLEEATAIAREDRVALRGRLRVNAPVSLGLVHFGGIVARFRARHPGVRIELSLDDAHINPTAEGIDVVVRITRSLADSALVARRLGTMHRITCAAPSYVARRGQPRSPAELPAHDCAVFGAGPRPDVLEFESADGPIEQRVEPCFVAGNSLLLRDAIVAGLGIALVPSYLVADDLAAGRLVELLPRYRPPEHGIYALCVRRRDQSARVRAFVDTLVAELGALTPLATRPTRKRGSARSPVRV